MYFPGDGQICVHQSRVCDCPVEFPAGYFWYGGKRKGPGRPPKWVQSILANGANQGEAEAQPSCVEETSSRKESTREGQSPRKELSTCNQDLHKEERQDQAPRRYPLRKRTQPNYLM